MAALTKKIEDMMNRKADTHLSDIRSYFLYYVKTDVLINVAIWSL